MNYHFIKIGRSKHIFTITLNRPEKRNALHASIIKELLHVLAEEKKCNSRVIILKGAGAHFCAGGDIDEMKTIANTSEKANVADANLLAELLYEFYNFPKPTIVLAHGTTLGGGMGLLSAADIVIAHSEAVFGFPEVNLGIIPAVISPYVVASIGRRLANYYFLTSEKFDADTAHAMQLVHKVVDNVETAGMDCAEQICLASPKAELASKKLLKKFVSHIINEDISKKTAEILSVIRASAEGQEGLQAYLEKRPPNWNSE